MAFYKFRDCLASEVDTQPIIEGSFLICRDTGDTFYDNLAGSRVTMGRSVHVVNGKVNSEMFPKTGDFYYSTEDKQICFYSGGEFKPINISHVNIGIGNCYVPANSSSTITVTNGEAVLDADNVIKAFMGDITTDLSIYDLFTEGDVTGTITVNGDNTGYEVTLTNSKNVNWMGSISTDFLVAMQYTA